MMEEGQEGAGSYRWLTEIKAEYDPQNVFRVNQNIRPAGR
jgi:hypothetical protein